MATDFGEKERAFIDGLKENTGRDLAEWMQEIAASGHVQRNDIIDWLRHKGLMFSKASWLERIHHNGGKPIYADAPKELPRDRARARRREGVLVAPLTGCFACRRSRRRPYAPPPASAPAPVGDVDALLAKAKAYRPLAQHVLAQDQVGAARRQFHGARKRHRHWRPERVRRARHFRQGAAAAPSAW